MLWSEVTMETRNSSGATTLNWTEAVEDLVHAGEIDQAISILEPIVARLEKEIGKHEFQNIVGSSSTSKDDQLYAAFQDLYKLYFAKGLSLRADQVLSRALQIKQRKGIKEAAADANSEAGDSANAVIASDGIAEDWEAIADRAPEELFTPLNLPGVSELSLEDSKVQIAKRRGRGTFSYKKQGLYSDNQSDETVFDDPETNSSNTVTDFEEQNFIYGTRHVLVLAGFSPNTRTTDLEKVFEKFKDRFVIRWVNDTTALAVFGTPSAALEASNSIQCSFTVNVLDQSSELLSSIQPKELEPPRPRPQTSARTAQRMIAQGMGIKLHSNFGSTELRKQEVARKNRILSRQNMRDDAWGADEN
ncbi:uncharacterized protein [Primulina eburnea]|uniref:uncharacterized protein n=1 Tax=Primulina eburnea TaxID=1245227 RepID=UPI003C6C8037